MDIIARRPGPSVQEIFDTDINPAPAVMRCESPATGQSTDDVSAERGHLEVAVPVDVDPSCSGGMTGIPDQGPRGNSLECSVGLPQIERVLGRRKIVGKE